MNTDKLVGKKEARDGVTLGDNVVPMAGLLIHLYYNHASLCFPNKKLATKERKEHKIRLFHLCDPCVLSRLFTVVAAQAALG
jgi:hypothetical protein